MEFYTRFAEYYDTIFPVDETKVSFLDKHFKRANELLDLGCATGGYAMALSREGFQVDGIDLSKEMIDLALLKTVDEKHSVSFWVDDMRRLDAVNRYEGVYLIGNTLVHLKEMQEIYEVITKIYKSLTRHGVFIVQIINYDRILEKDITALPTIKKEKVSLERNYHHNPPLIQFKTALTINGDKYEDETELFPLTSQALIIMLETIGFEEIHSYDGFNDQLFNKENSYQLVVVAKKHE